MEVTPPIETKISASASTEVTALASIKSYVHTNERFPGGPNDYFVMIGYVDHVTFKLWKGDVCI